MWINLFLVNIKVVILKIESIKYKKVSTILIKEKVINDGFSLVNRGSIEI